MVAEISCGNSRRFTLTHMKMSSGVCERSLEGHADWVRCVAVLPDGRVVSWSRDMTLRMWDASSGVCERVVKSMDADFALLDSSGHSLLSTAVALGHCGPMLATSTARFHASEELSASVAAGSIAAPVLVGGSSSGKVFFMTVVAASLAKQGGIILGIGGDNSDSAVGTFFEGVMTGDYTTDEQDDAMQRLVVAARYGT